MGGLFFAAVKKNHFLARERLPSTLMRFTASRYARASTERSVAAACANGTFQKSGFGDGRTDPKLGLYEVVKNG